jgi:hypothetical protein
MSEIAPGYPENLPQDIVALAAQAGLGGHRATYVPKRLGPGMLSLSAVMIVIGLFLFVLPGIYFLMIMLRAPNFSRTAATTRLHLFEYGLVVVHAPGVGEAFRWDSMSVLQQITNRNGQLYYLYTLARQDGSTVKLTGSYAHPHQWGSTIQQEITRAQLPAALAMGKRGEAVVFGDLVLSPDGLATAKRGMVSWHEIQDIKVNNGWVFIKRAGKLTSWSNTPVAKIPNFFLFLALAEQYYGRNRSAQWR